VEPFPDLASLSDEDLTAEIKKLTEEEQEVSYRRRLLHGRIDMLRAEAVARKQNEPSKALDQIDLDKLAEILAGKASPPSEEPA
jgi:hypothetical protein